MATRRRRRRRSGSQSNLVSGGSVTFGRDPRVARLLESLPRTLPAGLSRLDSPAPFRRQVGSRIRLRMRSETARERSLRIRRAERLFGKLLRYPRMPRESVCARRDRRRQVLHARGVAGVRGSAWKKMMRNKKSSIDSGFTCRR